ncbi:MAG: excinuclease ABC subunit UvrA [Candidatus Eisenbacteria sp.]|nr:excinuclease ABC subunit UvrA [Candidatus Eisenbacteria bacterium]
MEKTIRITGARENNLKGINLELRRGLLHVFSGVSGSGKSSLAVDTLFAEGQRRYIESLSTYARQFLEKMKRADVDRIEGLPPAILIERANPVTSSRSTVGTATEIHDYLRLLYARVGRVYCPVCSGQVSAGTVDGAVDWILARDSRIRIMVLFPAEVEGNPEVGLALWRKEGFTRMLLGDAAVDFSSAPLPDEWQKEPAWIIVDRLTASSDNRTRLTDSLEVAFREGGGVAGVWVEDQGIRRFTREFACQECGARYERPSPLLFSFNSSRGACPQCHGFGNELRFLPELIVPDGTKTLEKGAVDPWYRSTYRYMHRRLLLLAPEVGVRLDVPWEDLTDPEREAVLHGKDRLRGAVPFLNRLYRKRYRMHVRFFLKRYLRPVTCDLCGGNRLRPEALAVRIEHLNIAQFTGLPVSKALRFIRSLTLSEEEQQIAARLMQEIQDRLNCLDQIGLGYLTLDRVTKTLSGGEAQRITLAASLGSNLVETLYVLDEPTVGLHPRDGARLIAILKRLRDLGNTLVVVEHDREVISAADYLWDLGPKSGEQGGRIVCQGPPDVVAREGESVTARYLRDELRVATAEKRRVPQGKWLQVLGASEHNLKGIDVAIPLGLLVAMTGVSGSGKSTLVYDTLYRALSHLLNSPVGEAGRHREVRGAEHISEVIVVDQSPIGRSPRSNPATYVKAFDPVREAFAGTPAAKLRGFAAKDFSFNVPGGRCEACRGEGAVRVEMHFLADVFVPCEMCGGKRFSKGILEVTIQGRNIWDVLNLTVDQAYVFFSRYPRVGARLRFLKQVGLGYLRLGQPANRLSGGEAQRLKIARELGKAKKKDTLYLLDEPTTGLHPHDVDVLVKVLRCLVDAGNTVVVIEHNMDLVRAADYCIDLGPGGGEEGGWVVACGTPEEIAAVPESYTGQWLAAGNRENAGGKRTQR